MNQTVFAQRLNDAVAASRELARQQLEEPLPDGTVFHARLNSSYDGNPLHADEVVFSEDAGRRHWDLDAEEAVALLWREGRVPEWIDVSVIGVTDRHTRFELLCCGRFTANEQILYHLKEGRPPFHSVGPALPPEHVEGQRFSVHHRSRCARPPDLDRLRAHAAKVWSLELEGPDDAMLEGLLELPNLKILELNAAALQGYGLRALERHPKLSTLRVALTAPAQLKIPTLPRLRALANVTLSGLPARAWGLAHLIEATELRELQLAADDELFVDAALPIDLEALSLTGRKVKGHPRMPGRVGRLSVQLTEASDADLGDVLDEVDRVSALHLRGTPAGDALVERLAARWALEDLDVVDTKVSEAALDRLAAAAPKRKMHPTR